MRGYKDMGWPEKINLQLFYEAGFSDLPYEITETRTQGRGLTIFKPQIGHFYFGKNRTFLNWLDNVNKKPLTIPAFGDSFYLKRVPRFSQPAKWADRNNQ